MSSGRGPASGPFRVRLRPADLIEVIVQPGEHDDVNFRIDFLDSFAYLQTAYLRRALPLSRESTL